MATIRQRGERWQAIVRRKGYPPYVKTFDLMRDAERWARLQERQMDAGLWVDRSEAEQTTLADLLDRYGREVSVTKHGAEIEVIRIQVLKRSVLARYSVAAITSKLVSEWRDNRIKEVSGSTVTRELQLLSHVFNVAIREWSFGLSSNPITLVRKPKVAPARDRVLTHTEREALLTASASCRNPWVKPVVIFALETGCRRSELLSLEWTNIDLTKCIAKVDGKTGARTIPLSPLCASLLKTLPRSLDGRVFPVTVIPPFLAAVRSRVG